MAKLPSHLFLSWDGALYDTRVADWSNHPLREQYAYHFQKIDNVRQFKATLRAGAHAWPGGYALAFLANDCGVICFDCARKNLRGIFDSIANGYRDGWNVVGCFSCEGEEDETTCDNCAKPIE